MMDNTITETGSRKETNVQSLNVVFVWIVILVKEPLQKKIVIYCYNGKSIAVMQQRHRNINMYSRGMVHYGWIMNWGECERNQPVLPSEHSCISLEGQK